jgi:hypothetical protein
MTDPSPPPTVTELFWESARVKLTLKMFNIQGDPFGARHDIGRAYLVQIEPRIGVPLGPALRDYVPLTDALGFEATFTSERELDTFLHGVRCALTLYGETTFPVSLQALLIRWAERVELGEV